MSLLLLLGIDSLSVCVYVLSCVVLSQGNGKDSSLKRKHDETLNDELLTMLKVGGSIGAIGRAC